MLRRSRVGHATRAAQLGCSSSVRYGLLEPSDEAAHRCRHQQGGEPGWSTARAGSMSGLLAGQLICAKKLTPAASGRTDFPKCAASATGTRKLRFVTAFRRPATTLLSGGSGTTGGVRSYAWEAHSSGSWSLPVADRHPEPAPLIALLGRESECANLNGLLELKWNGNLRR
jgi:hypothetical protein